MRTALCTAAIIASASIASGQVVLTGSMTADNAFQAYVSTDPNVAGTNWLSGDNWPQTFSGSTNLNSAGTYYLHVAAQDFGPPMMFIGSFSLNSPMATFENGTQSLLTGVSNWTVSTTGFDGVQVAPTDLGPNGMGPWGNFPAMGDAHFIWDPQGALNVFFTATITVVPGVASVLPLLGVGVMGLRRRR